MEDFIMYEKYLEQLEEAGKIRNLKERSISCYKVSAKYCYAAHESRLHQNDLSLIHISGIMP